MNTQSPRSTMRFLMLITLCLASWFLFEGILAPATAHPSGKQLEDKIPTPVPKVRKEKAFGESSTVLPGQDRNRTLAYRFLIPEGYVGWIRVDFDVAGAPELPIEEDYYIFKFPTSGRLQTSSSDIVESRRNQFLYYSDKGKYLLKAGGPLNTRFVQEEFSGPGPGHLPPLPNRYRYIFIGPRAAFEKHRALNTQLRPKESDGYPKVGAHTWLSQEDLAKLIPRQP